MQQGLAVGLPADRGGAAVTLLRAAFSSDRAAFVPFLSAGFPRAADTPRLLRTLAEAGADVIELGVPFSDPLADGPIIQAASWQALEGGTSLSSTLELLGDLSDDLPPVVLFSYLNPILRMGVERFLERARRAGAAGLLITDLPVGSHPDLEGRLRASELDVVPLVAPTTPDARVDTIVGAATGFVYYIARLGVTGRQTTLDEDLSDRVGRLRARVGAPVAVGFGVATPEQAAAVARFADGVVVGSALIRALGESEARFGELARQLGTAVHGARPAR